MDWSESPELIEIFRLELDERAERLRTGAAAVASGPLSEAELDDLVRDAHTIKGSARMMGRVEVSTAAAALERAWTSVREGGGRATAGMASRLSAVAELLAEASRQGGTPPPGMVEAVASLEAATDREGSLVEAAVGAVAAATPPPGDPASDPEGGDDASLGGLLASIEEELAGVTRVDTGDLYRLINRTVEIGLDAEALADLSRVAFDGADPARLLAAWRGQLERLSDDVAELQAWAVSLANGRFGEAIETFPQFVRFLGRRLGKEVVFETNGLDLLVDRQIIDQLREPLRHLLVNAVDHGIEAPADRTAAGKPAIGRVALDARTVDDRLVIAVSDDGAGIDWEAVRAAAAERGLPTEPADLHAHLFRPGFTTRPAPTEFGGTGEGLFLLASTVDRMGGSASVESVTGQGTTVQIDLPRSLILQTIVVFASGDQFFGVAEPAVLGTVSLLTSSVGFGDSGRVLLFRGESVPIVSFAQAMGIPEREPENEALILSTRRGLVAVAVAEIIDHRRVAVKSLGPILEGGDHLTGAAFLGGGQIVVIVDHNFLGTVAGAPAASTRERPRVLVVDDSAGVRQIIAATLRASGYDVSVASSAREAVHSMARRRFDVLVVDYAMPRSNGVELVRALRHAGITLPVVMVSGVADESDKARAWEAGVDAYLDKFDVRRGALGATIERLLAERS